ncbi:response regulator [Flammeovirga yaeyamensis]|uniref:histidine kinase n=1 Tax=Flammeovirga yaeyamensis TaxID=367791 RepID=A0AAX1N2S6_9BACT|nr:hybrid sensor histidine kinase/response regulator transcription factor [Flammeovirga yaeyamensis]MBB3700742.1 signal transduction histidine kinase/ligand-binding sensor domain-containing protein/DNA-binding response OmpR family regulator [Flammeovirga yaeyamensis]NMF37902.1 response regulator [Flammeovirga yaeyamensis]QWG01737.1 response regulator [Flammeovirga yaeyamensis]
MKNWTITFFIWLSVLPYVFSQALPKRLQFDYLNTKDGLSQSNAITLLEDHQGQIWVGTRDGLNRYDGKKIDIFRNDPQNPNTLSNSDILDLALDNHVGIWVGTYHGLNHFDYQTRKVTRYLSGPSDSDQLSNNTVRSVATLKNGKVLVGTRDGLNILDPKTGRFTKFFHKDNDESSLPDNHVFKIYVGKDETVWIGTAKGLCILHQKGEDYYFEQIKPLKGKQLFVQEIISSSSNATWIGTKENGLIQLDENRRFVKQFKEENSDFSNNNVRAMTFDQEGRLWVGTYNGLNIITPNQQLITAYASYYISNDLSGNKIKSLHCSKDGTVWIGTYYSGVNTWNARNFNFNFINQTTTNNRLVHNVISSIEEHNGVFYFGTEGLGYISWDKTKDQFKNLNVKNSSLKSNYIKCLKVDPYRNELWVCTLDSGIVILDAQNNKKKLILNQKSGLSHNAVYDVAQYDKDHWWIATFGGGLNLYNRKTRKVEFNIQTKNSQLSDDMIRTMLVDADKNLWLGTQTGLTYLEINSKTFEVTSSAQYFVDDKKGMSADVIEIFQSKKGTIYVGTRELGMHQLIDDHFEFIDLFANLSASSQYIHAIEEDNNGTLWISSNNGIMSYAPQTGTKKIYQEADGLISKGFNNKASLKSTDGLMYFAGPTGIIQFDPEAFLENKYAPSVQLNDLWVNNQLVLPNDSTHILSQTLDQTQKVILNYDQSNFTIDFAFGSYVNSDKNQFVYRIKGLDDQWKFTNDYKANFTIQQAGNYEFQIKGVNNDGFESEHLKVLKIQVRPAPWLSPWALILYGCLIILVAIIVFLVMKRQTSLQYKLELNRKINQQEQEVNKSKLQFFTNISHEFRTPLTLILGTLEQIISDYQGSSQVYKKLTIMQRNTQQLMKLINQLMDFRKLENDKLKLEVVEGNIVVFTKSIFQSFQSMATKGNYQYIFESSKESISVFYDPHKLERVMYNLLSNAFKYTPHNEKIEVKISEEEHQIKISISDTGEGFPSEFKEKIFDRFYQISKELRKNQKNYGTGLGLAISKNIIELHQGELQVESEEGKGSCFTILLQKGNDHFEMEDLDRETPTQLYPMVADYTEEKKHGINVDQIVKVKEKQTLLVVEDNIEVRNFIVELLLSEYNIIEAENGEKGIEAVKENAIDLIISDVMMPEMDGITMCKHLKTNVKTSHIPIILLTARTAEQYKHEGLEIGADEYLNKPFNVQELKLKVRNLLRFVDQLKIKFKEENVIRPSEITLSSVDEELLDKAISIIDENIENQFFNVEQFGEDLGLSRTMLFTKIKMWTGLTPNEFILSMRMKRAAQLIEQNKINISQICYKVGFKDPKYFSKSFKKYHGCTPTAYGKKFQENVEIEP